MNIETIQLSDDRSRLTTYPCSAPLAYNPSFSSPAVIICPGGGFGRLSPREMEPIALRFVSEGISAFVLEYPVGDESGEADVILSSIALAVAYVRSNAGKYSVRPDQISVCGFSAGGYVAASLAVGWKREDICSKLNLTPEQIRPNGAILCYPVIDIEKQRGYHEHQYKGETINLADAMRYRLLGAKDEYTKEEKDSIALQKQVSSDTCPCFIWHTANDQSVHVDNSLCFSQAMAKYNVPFEMHIFGSGVHGLALSNHITEAREEDVNKSCACWFDLCINWLREQFA